MCWDISPRSINGGESVSGRLGKTYFCFVIYSDLFLVLPLFLCSGADEVVLFERATFLVISHVTEKTHDDVHRFEKISNIIKQFKLSVSKTGYELSAMMASVFVHKEMIIHFHPFSLYSDTPDRADSPGLKVD